MPQVTAQIDAFLTAANPGAAKTALDTAVGQVLSTGVEVGTTAPDPPTARVVRLTAVAYANEDFVIIGDVQYNFVDEYSSFNSTNEVEISTDPGEPEYYTGLNLIAAINGEDQRNPPNPLVVASEGSGITLTARTPGSAGNDIVFESSGDQSFADVVNGSDGSEGPPYIRIADGKIYALDAGVWKQAALSALS